MIEEQDLLLSLPHQSTGTTRKSATCSIGSSRIEGQIRGIRGMVEKDAYCPDILTQVAAASAALNSFSKVLLANHIKTCVAQDIRDGKDETIDELLTTLQKLMPVSTGERIGRDTFGTPSQTLPET